MDKFELSMDLGSVHQWTYLEGVRDIIQNFADNPNDSDWSFEDGTLTLTNRDTQLPRKIFLHGNSSKRGDDTQRGCHGDGTKSAICVLLREGHQVTMDNAGLFWKPVVEYSPTFDSDVVVIHEEESRIGSDDFTVKIKGLTDTQWACIVESTLLFQEDYEAHSTSSGEILLDDRHKGKVFCGGLFVCNFKSDYGYNFDIGVFQLDRDRKALRPFDIQWQTKDMFDEWSKSATEEDATRIVNSMVNCDQAVAFSNRGYNNSPPNINVQNAVEEVYKENYSGKLVTSDYDEFKEMQAAGNEVELLNNEGLVNIIRNTEEYKVAFEGKKTKKTVSELLEDFKQEWYPKFSSEMLYAYEDMQQTIDN